MAAPQASDLVYYTNTPLTDTDWATNWNKTIAWLTDTTFDFSINDLTLAGDLVVAGAATVTGAITGGSFVGDGSSLTGLNTINKNYVTNGVSSVKEAGDYTLVKDVYGTGFIFGRAQDLGHYGMATGTAVSAGTFTQTTSANAGTTTYAFKYAGVTLTGAGVINHRYRMQSKDAINLINQSVSFGVQVYHDTGSSINYTITINKADGIDDFSAVTEIDNGVTAVTTATATKLELENVSMGNCFNGVEIIIKMTTGAITTKNYELTELQLEISATSTTYDFKTFKAEGTDSMFNFDGSIMQCGGYLGSYNLDNGVDGRLYVAPAVYVGDSGGTQMILSVGGGSRFTVDATDIVCSVATTTIGADLVTSNGVYIVSQVSGNLIDNASNGGTSTTMYIGNQSITVSSDIRIKKDIEDTKINALETIDKFRIVDFSWNDPSDKEDAKNKRGRYTGMIAQEVINITPWIINDQDGKDCPQCQTGIQCNKHPDPWIVEYEHLVPTLAKAIQELRAEVNLLKQRG